MSLTILKAGILDTIQDEGRYGFQHAGINPGGAMDAFSACLCNALLGKTGNAPVIEMHFPAPVIRFEKDAVICLTGAGFFPHLDDIPIENNRPFATGRNTILHFKKASQDTRCYLSLLPSFSLPRWLGSYSTNLKINVNGFRGRALQNGDVLPYNEDENIKNFLNGKKLRALPFKAKPESETATDVMEVIAGAEWNGVTGKSQYDFVTKSFIVSNSADRMGYRLQGELLSLKEPMQLVSSAVSFGTLQLLPNGQLIVLMADHQTTGGYPRIGHVISAHLPRLAQMKPNAVLRFRMVDINTAEEKYLQQQRYLSLVQEAASLHIKKLLS